MQQRTECRWNKVCPAVVDPKLQKKEIKGGKEVHEN